MGLEGGAPRTKSQKNSRKINGKLQTFENFQEL